MENFISRWKLNHENLKTMLNLLVMDKGSFIERCSWPIEELGIISDFVANRVVCEIKKMLDDAKAEIKILAVKLIANHCEKTVETSKDGHPIATPKILSVDRLYKGKGNKFENQSKWFLFFYLFDLDEVESTFVDKIDAEKKVEF